MPDEDAVEIDFSRAHGVYPNGAVPFAAAVSFYRAAGVLITGANMTKNVERTHLLNPMRIGQFERFITPLTNNVWRYDTEEEAQKLADRYVDALVDQVRCENGVVDTLNWCLYEVMDNVFQHSRADGGFVMMQIHKESRKCVIAVGDTGRGIQLSLVAGSTDLDRQRLSQAHVAIGYAVEQGITSKGKLNQGNGLFGLKRASKWRPSPNCVGPWRLVQ
ncbi:hypothetical protein [Agreia sp. COWG]|uniref:hypothetical protein n=1 Tax=Agreia sp. COWG TaxID=2773266 RepID=UPI001AF243A8|nr:hypothetical protein [Agreia sp. COWG]CAD6008567.1 protein of unknown function [Agreia sp. COWG]